MTLLSDLQEKFSIDNIRYNNVNIEEDREGLVKVLVRNKFASAEIHLQGAHVTHFQPLDDRPLLWLSKNSLFEKGIPIRGGVPICWPWFGAHPTEASYPAHGFARTSVWSLDRVSALEDGSTIIELGLEASQDSRKYWPYDFVLSLSITVGESLKDVVNNQKFRRRIF